VVVCDRGIIRFFRLFLAPMGLGTRQERRSSGISTMLFDSKKTEPCFYEGRDRNAGDSLNCQGVRNKRKKRKNQTTLCRCS
jgi:hypothetical protein